MIDHPRTFEVITPGSDGAPVHLADGVIWKRGGVIYKDGQVVTSWQGLRGPRDLREPLAALGRQDMYVIWTDLKDAAHHAELNRMIEELTYVLNETRNRYGETVNDRDALSFVLEEILARLVISDRPEDQGAVRLVGEITPRQMATWRAVLNRGEREAQELVGESDG